MKRLLWLVPILIVLVAGCGKKENKVLMSIGGEKITVGDFQERIDKIPDYLRGYFQGEEGFKSLLDGLVKEKVLVREAKRKRLDRQKDLKEKLNVLENQLLVEEMVKELKKKEIAITDEEARDYFKKNKNDFVTSDKIRVRHILLQTEDEAKEVLGKIKKGDDFTKLAREHSIDKVTADKGGDLGYFSKGEFIAEFEEAAFAMTEKGQISDIVKTPFGLHIIKLIDKKQKDDITLSDVEEEVRKKLEKEKFDAWMEKKKKKFRVKVNYEMLAEIQFNRLIPQLEEGEGK